MGPIGQLLLVIAGGRPGAYGLKARAERDQIGGVVDLVGQGVHEDARGPGEEVVVERLEAWSREGSSTVLTSKCRWRGNPVNTSSGILRPQIRSGDATHPPPVRGFDDRPDTRDGRRPASAICSTRNPSHPTYN